MQEGREGSANQAISFVSSPISETVNREDAIILTRQVMECNGLVRLLRIKDSSGKLLRIIHVTSTDSEKASFRLLYRKFRCKNSWIEFFLERSTNLKTTLKKEIGLKVVVPTPKGQPNPVFTLLGALENLGKVKLVSMSSSNGQTTLNLQVAEDFSISEFFTGQEDQYMINNVSFKAYFEEEEIYAREGLQYDEPKKNSNYISSRVEGKGASLVKPRTLKAISDEVYNRFNFDIEYNAPHPDSSIFQQISVVSQCFVKDKSDNKGSSENELDEDYLSEIDIEDQPNSSSLVNTTKDCNTPNNEHHLISYFHGRDVTSFLQGLFVEEMPMINSQNQEIVIGESVNKPKKLCTLDISTVSNNQNRNITQASKAQNRRESIKITSAEENVEELELGEGGMLLLDRISPQSEDSQELFDFANQLLAERFKNLISIKDNLRYEKHLYRQKWRQEQATKRQAPVPVVESKPLRVKPSQSYNCNYLATSSKVRGYPQSQHPIQYRQHREEGYSQEVYPPPQAAHFVHTAPTHHNYGQSYHFSPYPHRP